MIKLSASSIKDYIACPRKVFYRTYKPEESIQTEAMAIGSAVHEIFEEKWMDEKLAVASVNEKMGKYGLETNFAYDKIRLCIDNFFPVFGHLFGEGDEIEKYFRLKFSDDLLISGMLDRIHNNIIIDWKTSTYPPKNLNNDIQFIVYYLAYKMLYGKEPTAVVYASVFKGKSHIFKPNKDVIAKFKNEVLPYVYNGVKYKIFPGLGEYHYSNGICKNCSYRKHCLEGK